MTMTTATVRVHADEGAMRDDDPTARPTRRRFSAAYKLAIFDEYERLTDPGAKGTLLRACGLAGRRVASEAVPDPPPRRDPRVAWRG